MSTVNSQIWEDFQYRFLETGWFDDDRVKTVEATRRLSERMPGIVYDALPALLVMAPSQHVLGQIYPELHLTRHREGVIVYLSPELESKAQEEVDFTVAHEFAHVHLGHRSLRENPPTLEDDADSLVQAWGYSLPERRKAR